MGKPPRIVAVFFGVILLILCVLVSAAFSAGKAHIRVSCDPSGAQLFVKSPSTGKFKRIGSTLKTKKKRRIPIKPGLRTIEARKAGYVTQPWEIDLEDGDVETHEFELKPMPRFVVRCDPAGAQISVKSPSDSGFRRKGARLKKKEKRTLVLPPGINRIRVHKPGYKWKGRKVPLEPGDRKSHHFKLEKLPPAFVVVSCDPDGARILVKSLSHGKYKVMGNPLGVGETKRLKLTSGKRRIGAKKAGFKSEVWSVNLNPGDEKTHDFKLDLIAPPATLGQIDNPPPENERWVWKGISYVYRSFPTAYSSDDPQQRRIYSCKYFRNEPDSWTLFPHSEVLYKDKNEWIKYFTRRTTTRKPITAGKLSAGSVSQSRQGDVFLLYQGATDRKPLIAVYAGDSQFIDEPAKDYSFFIYPGFENTGLEMNTWWPRLHKTLLENGEIPHALHPPTLLYTDPQAFHVGSTVNWLKRVEVKGKVFVRPRLASPESAMKEPTHFEMFRGRPSTFWKYWLQHRKSRQWVNAHTSGATSVAHMIARGLRNHCAMNLSHALDISTDGTNHFTWAVRTNPNGTRELAVVQGNSTLPASYDVQEYYIRAEELARHRLSAYGQRKEIPGSWTPQEKERAFEGKTGIIFFLNAYDYVTESGQVLRIIDHVDLWNGTKWDVAEDNPIANTAVRVNDHWHFTTHSRETINGSNGLRGNPGATYYTKPWSTAQEIWFWPLP